MLLCFRDEVMAGHSTAEIYCLLLVYASCRLSSSRKRKRIGGGGRPRTKAQVNAWDPPCLCWLLV